MEYIIKWYVKINKVTLWYVKFFFWATDANALELYIFGVLINAPILLFVSTLSRFIKVFIHMDD